MDVTLRPPLNGCLLALLGLMTLGLFPLLRRMGERHFVRRMDDAGIETRGGRRIAWGDITEVTRVVGKMGAATLSEELVIRSAKGKASLPLWRAENAEAATDYFFRRVPPGAVRPR